jgi:translation elongation factor EF-Tu-like GTPase
MFFVESYVIAQVDMKFEGGRHCEFSVGYVPHLVVPPDSTFLGVRVVEIEDSNGDEVVYPGATAKVLLQLMYSKVDYSALVEGVRFNIHEGACVVGTGQVLEIFHPDEVSMGFNAT